MLYIQGSLILFMLFRGSPRLMGGEIKVDGAFNRFLQSQTVLFRQAVAFSVESKQLQLLIRQLGGVITKGYVKQLTDINTKKI